MTPKTPKLPLSLLILSWLSIVGLLGALGLGFLAFVHMVSVDIHVGVSLIAIILALITHMKGKEGVDLLSALLLLIVVGSGLGTASGILSGTTHTVIAILALFSSVGAHLRRLSMA